LNNGKLQTSTVLTVALAALAMASMGMLLYLQIGALNRARDAVAREREALARAEVQLQKLVRAKARAVAVQQELARVNHLLPPEPQEDALLRDLKEAAIWSGLDLTEVRFEKRVSKAGYVEMPLKLVFEGRYPCLVELLAALQAGPRALRIDEVKVGKGRKEFPFIKADVSATAFYAADGGAKGKEAEHGAGIARS
jgi:type IV pilus assembly protein PilO